MIIIKYRKLKMNLIKNFGYTDFQAKEAIKKIRNFEKEIKKSFAVWNTSGNLPEYEVEGFTLRELIDILDINTIAAFIYLDWLKKEPHVAKKSLLRSYDSIKLSSEYREKMEKLWKDKASNENGKEVVEEEPEDTSDINVEEETN